MHLNNVGNYLLMLETTHNALNGIYKITGEDENKYMVELMYNISRKIYATLEHMECFYFKKEEEDQENNSNNNIVRIIDAIDIAVLSIYKNFAGVKHIFTPEEFSSGEYIQEKWEYNSTTQKCIFTYTVVSIDVFNWYVEESNKICLERHRLLEEKVAEAKALKQIKDFKAKLNTNGKRKGVEFSETEYYIGVEITQICSNKTKEGYLTYLQHIFNKGRAEAILNKILYGE